MGTTKRIVKDQLAQMRDWVQRLTDAVNSDAAFKAMADNDEFSGDAAVWQMFAAAAADKVFAKFSDMAGLRNAPATERAASDDEKTNIAFDDFLGRISRSMVKTQETLDTESARYLAATAGKGHILPSIFRLPKLSAQMRFALDVEETEGLNLIFYKRDEKTTSRNEQAIDFDIVSVPAPPDARSAVLAISPRLDLVLDPFERSAVVDAISKQPATGTNGPLVQAASNPTDLVILALMPEENVQRYLVLFAQAKGTEKSVGTWRLTVLAGGAAVLETVYPLNRKNAENEGLLREVVLAAAERQKQFLAG